MKAFRLVFGATLKGAVLLDGTDIRELTLKSLREQISLVLQDVFLFNGTVRENVLFACPEATEAQLTDSCEAANALSFIAELPDGLDTVVGERGIKLSGGQKQRISIARALLKNAPVLILDEATSSVDTGTEYLIQQALKRLMEGRTTITIAHRLSTIRNSDKIIVIDSGKIIEQGTHEQLLSCEGMYYRMINMQKMHEEPVGSLRA